MQAMLRKRLSTSFLAACIATVCLMRGTTALAGQAEDQSVYLGQPVDHPEELSGLWEAPDGRGGVLSLHLTLLTAVPATAKTLRGTPQSWFVLEVALHRNSGAALDFKSGDWYSFNDSERGDGLRYQAGRLKLSYGLIDLNLFHNSRDQWTGHLRGLGFKGYVILRRPGAKRKQSWLDGTWSSGEAPSWFCLHVAEDTPNHHVAWIDNLQLPGLFRYAPNVPRLQFANERYGELADANRVGVNQASITLGAYNGLCCSNSFLATEAADGASMRVADWPPKPNQQPNQKWVRMEGNSCLGSPPAGR